MPCFRVHLRSTSPSFVPILMKSLRRALAPLPDARPPRGLLDTSVLVELEQIEVTSLPIEVAISAITMAELGAGTHATSDTEERARRQDRLQRAEAAFHPALEHGTFGPIAVVSPPLDQAQERRSIAPACGPGPLVDRVLALLGIYAEHCHHVASEGFAGVGQIRTSSRRSSPVDAC